MTYQLVQETGRNTYIIDGLALNLPKRTATFILDEKNLTLINIGAPPAVKHIKNSLIKLNSLLSRVKYIIVSDLELDSMGGVGVLLRSCPNAEVIAPKGFMQTLTEPKQLIQATRAIYGDYFSEHFEPIRPIEKDKIREVVDGDKISIGDRSLHFILPENSTYLLSFDQSRNELYTGHALGVYYDQLQDEDVDLFLPSIPASIFDLTQYRNHLKVVKELKATSLYFNHFGKTNKVELALNQLNHWLELFILITQETIESNGNYNDLSSKFLTVVHRYLKDENIPDNHPIYQYIILDLNTCALTMLNYFKKIKK